MIIDTENDYIVYLQEIIINMVERGYTPEKIESIIETSYDEVYEEYFFTEDLEEDD